MLRGSLLAAVLLALAIGASVSNAAFHGHNGRIVFAQHGETSGDVRIYSMTVDATKRRLLARGGTGTGMPAYSRNGRKIVFVRCSKRCDLWTMRSDGTHQRRLTHTAHLDEEEPGWSPDGKEIVFQVLRPTSDGDYAGLGIWIVGSDGRGRRQLTTDGGFPSWSPNGSEIAFSGYDPDRKTGGIFVVSSSGGTPTDLSTRAGSGGSDYEPDWSPDGSRIVFASDPDTFRSDLWLMDADGSHARLVTASDNFDVYEPVWSPDGRWIAYEGDDQHSDQIYVSRPDGSRLRGIPHACQCSRYNEDPSWQPLP